MLSFTFISSKLGYPYLTTQASIQKLCTVGSQKQEQQLNERALINNNKM